MNNSKAKDLTPWLFGLAVFVLTLPVSAQEGCFGLARGGDCIGSWVSQVGYDRRIDAGTMGLHRFTWEFGPQAYLPRHGVGIGGSVITAFDENGESQFGIKVRGVRSFGMVGLHLGVGALLTDSRRVGGEISLTTDAAISFRDHIHAVATLEAFERGSSSESRVYVGVRLLKFDRKMFLPSLAITFVAFIATIFLS